MKFRKYDPEKDKKDAMRIWMECGWMEDEDKDMTPLFEAIIEKVPYPKGSPENDTQAQVFTLDSDNFVGRIGITRIFNGKVKKGDEYLLVKACGAKSIAELPINKIID